VSQNDVPEEHVVYPSTDGHVHELWRHVGAGAWVHTDLTHAARTKARAAGNVTGWGSTTRRVAYRGTDGHLHVLSWGASKKRWHETDVTKATKTTARLATDPFMRDCALIYRSKDRHIHLLGATAGHWKDTDVWAKAKAKVGALGRPTVYHSNNPAPAVAAWHVLYRGTDNHVHELLGLKGGTWSTTDLTKLTKLPANVTSDPVGWPGYIDVGRPTLTVRYLRADGRECAMTKETGNGAYASASPWVGGCLGATGLRFLSPIVAAASEETTTWVTRTGDVWIDFSDLTFPEVFDADLTTEAGAPRAATGVGLYVTPACSCYQP
jgi:hypothetical protein